MIIAAFNLRPTDCGDINAIYEFAGEAALRICPDGVRAADGSYFFIEENSKEIPCDGDADPTRCREDTVPLAYPKPVRRRLEQGP